MTDPSLNTRSYPSLAFLGSVKYLEKSVPMRFSLDTPVILTVASFTSVIFPFRLIVTSGSRLASIRLRAYCDVSDSCFAVASVSSSCCFCFCLVFTLVSLSSITYTMITVIIIITEVIIERLDK